MDDDLQANVSLDCTTYTFDTQPFLVIAQRICQLLGVDSYELSLTFTNNAHIHELNKKYRSMDRPTDVLAFPQITWEQPLVITEPMETKSHQTPQALGDIIISLEQAAVNAKDIGHSLPREVSFLIAHGVLHLCGHDHKEADDEALMISQQKIIMADHLVQSSIPTSLELNLSHQAQGQESTL